MKKITILRVWAALCLLKPKAKSWLPHGQAPKLRAYLLIYLLLNLSAAPLMAQEMKALKLGDRLPDSFWLQPHSFYRPGQTYTSNLLGYKGKLLILDFWATWCSTCYHKLPYLDSLVKVKGQNLAVLMVNTLNTGDGLDKIKASLSKFNEGKGFGLASIYNDAYLVKLFPHGMLSHYVWINKMGIVVAITGSDFINDTNINLCIARFNKP